jgi:DNA sulfur modification protein DndB
MEKSTISNRSTKLFTLSSIKHSNRALLRKQPREAVSEEEKLLAKEYWDAVGEKFPDWRRAKERAISTAELRQSFVHAHGVALQALGFAGAALISSRPKDWRAAIKKLRYRLVSNQYRAVGGRAMIHGRISKASTNVMLTANVIKRALGLKLNEELAWKKPEALET